MQQAVSITATGSYTPTQVMDNHQLVARFGLTVDDAWIVSRTGIRSRHWLQPGETTSDMAVIAAQRCLDQAGISASQVDRIIMATISPDLPSPSTATIVARKLARAAWRLTSRRHVLVFCTGWTWPPRRFRRARAGCW